MTCKKMPGETIYLALSGAGGVVIGAVTFVACHGPFLREEWVARAQEHCVAGDVLPYGQTTYAWEFRSPVRFRAPVAFRQKPGQVTWAKNN